MKKKAELKNWHKSGECIAGEVYGHPDFNDGDLVRTSKVINWDQEANIVETRNTIYTLNGAYK